ncbi:MAG: putative toxin-antitoxin system toxin component, PIN family [Comamonadaceae bacterium]|nr:putative toxin-antitoxin system toxin component, PIN family [Comamonadaceae bacterium]
MLDTNIVLDIFVFQDPATESLRQALDDPNWYWIASAPMRDELVRVLDYPQIARRLSAASPPKKPECALAMSTDAVLGQFDTLAHILPTAAKASVTCRDPDDQKFIDLAVAHQALLLSKDKAVLCMKKRLLALGVKALSTINS